MAVPEPDTTDATHRVVTNEVSPDAAPQTWVRAENAVVATCLDRGGTAFLAVDEAQIRAHDEGVVETLSSLARVGDDYLRADPADLETVVSALSVEDRPGPLHKALTWRSQGIERITTLLDGRWRYDSVPADEDARWLRLPDRELRTALEPALARVPVTGLFPAEPVRLHTDQWAEIQVGPHAIDCFPDEIVVERYHFVDLQRILVDVDAREVTLDWAGPYARAKSSLGRVARGIVDRVRESPPTRLSPADQERFDRLRAHLSTMASSLGYDVLYHEL